MWVYPVQKINIWLDYIGNLGWDLYETFCNESRSFALLVL